MNRYRKWINLALVLTVLAFGFLLAQMLSQVWEIFRLPVFEQWPLPLPKAIALVVGVAVFIGVRSQPKAMGFLEDVANELSKVTWPNPQETIASTGVIIVMVGIASLIMFVFDTLWGTLTRSFLTL